MRIAILLILAFLIAPINGPALVAQEAASATIQEPATEQQQEPSEAYKLYRQKRIRHKQIDGEISDIYANMPIGFREKRKEMLAKIESLKTEKQNLTTEVFEASIEAFRQEETPEPLLTRDVVTYAQANLSGNNFEFGINPNKCLGICELVIAKHGELHQLHELAARAALATHNFAKVEEHMAKVEELGGLTEDLTKFKTFVETLKQARAAEDIKDQTPNNRSIVRFQTTAGEFTVELFEDEAPNTVANFMSLVNSKFYEGQRFFEVNRGSYCRVGCPVGDGTGDAGYHIENEAKLENARTHFAGTLSMIPDGTTLHCSSQFMITQSPMNSVNDGFPVFGRVIDGMDIIYKIHGPRVGPNGERIPPVEITATDIINKRRDNYFPQKVAGNE